MYIILYTDRVRVVDLIKVRRWGRGPVGYLIKGWAGNALPPTHPYTVVGRDLSS